MRARSRSRSARGRDPRRVHTSPTASSPARSRSRSRLSSRSRAAPVCRRSSPPSARPTSTPGTSRRPGSSRRCPSSQPPRLTGTWRCTGTRRSRPRSPRASSSSDRPRPKGAFFKACGGTSLLERTGRGSAVKPPSAAFLASLVTAAPRPVEERRKRRRTLPRERSMCDRTRCSPPAVQLKPSRLRSATDPDLIEDGAAPSAERKNANEQTEELHLEVEAFARWFADWWLRRRCGHAGNAGHATPAQRRAA